MEHTAADQKSQALSQRRQPEFGSETTEKSRAGKFNSTFNHCVTRDNKFKSEPNREKEKAVANRIRVIMKPNSVAWWLCSIICIVFVCGQFQGCVGSKTKRTDEAYVTLLYGDEFLLGVRVLGKSIRNTGSSKDMVVLVSDGVSDYAKSLLRVYHHLLLNGSSTRFEIFNFIFLLTPYFCVVCDFNC